MPKSTQQFAIITRRILPIRALGTLTDNKRPKASRAYARIQQGRRHQLTVATEPDAGVSPTLL